MLEITSDDIAALNDEDLRSLVGMLCESELRSNGLSTSAVTWGGNQNAADGGIDVRVKIENGPAPGGFIPRTRVGFQVKKTDFTPGLIVPEMRPSGELRPSISHLIDERGAYIIASSGSDTSDSALTDRLNVMRSAVADKVGHSELHLNFYDRNRLATWTRSHPGLILWVRQKIGRSISGWKPYGSWAASPDGIQDEYLLDDKARLHTGATDEKGINVTQGIERIREILREVRGVVRLAGLSGVGKTRLVQALFDERVGSNPLDEVLAVYADMNDNPSPQPTGMISDLIASRMRAIVVIDNCAPDLHRRITEICRESSSLISAITVEYDVQEDEPEGTEVFRLEPSSVPLVAKLIARRFPTRTQLDVDKIAEFSGGNARVALALANALERHESVAGLQDEELFRRLFHQRQERDDSLLRAAQACALLYSFQGEALNGDDAELPKIAALVGMSAQEIFAKVAQLKQRDLVQRRSVWRAILPHAIANRLAKMALREIPLELIEQQFDTQRLMKSFSRRLGYLHESDEAKRIAEKWLAKGGLLASVGRLNETGFAMFQNVAPISPETTLKAIELELSGLDANLLTELQSRRDSIGMVLHSIAYDASLFERCVAAMISLALAEPSDGRTHPIEQALEGLFHIILSGTHATIEQRARVADSLLHSPEPKKRSLGLELFTALLKAEHFSATHSFEFGARVRDYGYWPGTREESTHWFVTTLQMAREFASKNDETALAIRSEIAQSIRSVWFLGPEVQKQFEAIAAEIATNNYWQEGWIAARSVLSHPPGKADATATERLQIFERSLRPKNVIEQVRAVVLPRGWGPFDYADMDGDGDIESERPIARYEKANAAAEELGKLASGDEAVFKSLLPDLVTGDAGRLALFGKGLAIASIDRQSVWEQLTAAFGQVEEGKRNAGTLVGFLVGLSSVDEPLCEALLEEALTHEILGAWFPVLQTSVTISAAGASRLKRAVTLGKAPVRVFRHLAWGRSSDPLNGDDLGAIVLSLAQQENGYGVATDILSMRFHSDHDQKREDAPELINAGRKLLAEAVFKSHDNMQDYSLQSIANVCLRGSEGAIAAQLLCERIKQGLADYSFHAYNYGKLLKSIFQLQPTAALSVFFVAGSQTDGADLDVDDFDDPSDRRPNPLDGVPMDNMLQWCDAKPDERYPVIARAVSYQTAAENGGVEWTPLALEMLKRAPDAVSVLETFVNRFSPTSWSGSRAAIVESRVPLLDQLDVLNNPALAEFVAKIRPELSEEIARMRKWENEQDRERDERFE